MRRAYDKFDQIKQLEGRIEYVEGVIYHLFQLTEKLLETVKKLKDDEVPQESTHTKIMAFMTVLGGC
jgi:hypothetical protein